MRPVYLNNWSELIDMVGDFWDVYLLGDDYRAEKSPYPNEAVWLERKSKMNAALNDPQLQGIEVLLASYGCANYSGDAFVLFRKDGKLFEVNACHCSCYGLEGQWSPEETTVESLRHRLENGRLGEDDYSGNVFKDEIALVIAAIEKGE